MISRTHTSVIPLSLYFYEICEKAKCKHQLEHNGEMNSMRNWHARTPQPHDEIAESSRTYNVFPTTATKSDSLVASRNGRDPTSGPMDLSVGRSVYSSRWLHQVPTASSTCWRSSWRSSKRSVHSIDLTINLSYDSAILHIYRWIIIHFLY